MDIRFGKSNNRRIRSRYSRKIKNAREKNKEVVRVVKDIKKMGVKMLRGDEWQIDEELVSKKEKVYILKNKELRVEIIQLHHDVLVVGYGERLLDTVYTLLSKI